MHWLNRSISIKQVLGQVTLGQFTLCLFVFWSKLFRLNFGVTTIFWDKYQSGQISFFWDKFPYVQISLDEFFWVKLLWTNAWDKFSVHLKCLHFKPNIRGTYPQIWGWVPYFRGTYPPILGIPTKKKEKGYKKKLFAQKCFLGMPSKKNVTNVTLGGRSCRSKCYIV